MENTHDKNSRGKESKPFQEFKNRKFQNSGNKREHSKKDKFTKRRKNDTANFRNRDNRPIGKHFRK